MMILTVNIPVEMALIRVRNKIPGGSRMKYRINMAARLDTVQGADTVCSMMSIVVSLGSCAILGTVRPKTNRGG